MALRPSARFTQGVKQVTGTVSVRGTDQETGLSLSAAAQVTIERPALTGVGIEGPSGPIVAGGDAVTFRAAPTPQDADANVQWTVAPTTLGSFKPKITKPGEKTAFKPGAKPGKGTVLAKDTLSKVPPASVSVQIQDRDCVYKSGASEIIRLDPVQSKITCKFDCCGLPFSTFPVVDGKPTQQQIDFLCKHPPLPRCKTSR